MCVSGGDEVGEEEEEEDEEEEGEGEDVVNELAAPRLSSFVECRWSVFCRCRRRCCCCCCYFCCFSAWSFSVVCC